MRQREEAGRGEQEVSRKLLGSRVPTTMSLRLDAPAMHAIPCEQEASWQQGTHHAGWKAWCSRHACDIMLVLLCDHVESHLITEVQPILIVYLMLNPGLILRPSSRCTVVALPTSNVTIARLALDVPRLQVCEPRAL